MQQLIARLNTKTVEKSSSVALTFLIKAPDNPDSESTWATKTKNIIIPICPNSYGVKILASIIFVTRLTNKTPNRPEIIQIVPVIKFRFREFMMC
jgi:hypothetical protein